MKTTDLLAVIIVFGIISKVFIKAGEFSNISFWYGFLLCLTCSLITDYRRYTKNKENK